MVNKSIQPLDFINGGPIKQYSIFVDDIFVVHSGINTINFTLGGDVAASQTQPTPNR